MVVSLLYYTGRIDKWCTVLGASDTMRMAHAPIRGQILANSDLGRLHDETSSGRYILISFDLLERLNRALAMTGLRTFYFRGIITHGQVSKR